MKKKLLVMNLLGCILLFFVSCEKDQNGVFDDEKASVQDTEIGNDMESTIEAVWENGYVIDYIEIL